MEIRDIFLCMYSFFYGNFTRASLTARHTALFTRVLRTSSGVHTTHKEEKGKQSKRRREWEREVRQNESKKGKVVRII